MPNLLPARLFVFGAQNEHGTAGADRGERSTMLAFAPVQADSVEGLSEVDGEVRRSATGDHRRTPGTPSPYTN
jgi:hypothetical protein